MSNMPTIEDMVEEFCVEIAALKPGEVLPRRGIPYYNLCHTGLRIQGAWAVLTGNAVAVQFAEDAK